MVFVTVFECKCVNSTFLGHNSLILIIFKLTTTICENPGVPVYGSTAVASNSVGPIAEHFCDERFNLNVVSWRKCLVNGSWPDPLPTCVSK